MRVLVVTIVHDPRDARISHREISALRSAGFEVTYAAPFTGYGLSVPADGSFIDLPRAQGRNRLPAIRAARELVKSQSPNYDVVLFHDPELLIAGRVSKAPVTVWDVHEDTAAAVTLKPWLPDPLRQPTAAIFAKLEAEAESRFKLILAEPEYAQRFRRTHPVVPNSTSVPDEVTASGNDRIVYVGSITEARGAFDIIDVGRRLSAHGVTTHVIGTADAHTKTAMAQAHAHGDIMWHGFLPNDEAMRIIDGAMAGLSLLHDEPNYRHSQPTKVLEYMAHGVPVITTPLPRAVAIIEAYSSGLVVPFNDPVAVTHAVLQLKSDDGLRESLAQSGHSAALANFNWNRDGAQFADILRTWVDESR
jgi:glycosyltransferase involved in cell wall biosynthesis